MQDLNKKAMTKQLGEQKMKKEVQKKVTKNIGVKKKMSKSSTAIMCTGHFINNLEEIGWISPNGELDETHNIAQAKFNVFIYDVSKYVKEFPPLMVYLPNSKVWNALAKACVKGQKCEEILKHFTDSSLISSLQKKLQDQIGSTNADLKVEEKAEVAIEVLAQDDLVGGTDL
jgi:hypothetical protein